VLLNICPVQRNIFVLLKFCAKPRQKKPKKKQTKKFVVFLVYFIFINVIVGSHIKSGAEVRFRLCRGDFIYLRLLLSLANLQS
jgi:phosphate starvation-inducible membrane PsiE